MGGSARRRERTTPGGRDPRQRARPIGHCHHGRADQRLPRVRASDQARRLVRQLLHTREFRPGRRPRRGVRAARRANEHGSMALRNTLQLYRNAERAKAAGVPDSLCDQAKTCTRPRSCMQSTAWYALGSLGAQGGEARFIVVGIALGRERALRRAWAQRPRDAASASYAAAAACAWHPRQPQPCPSPKQPRTPRTPDSPLPQTRQPQLALRPQSERASFGVPGWFPRPRARVAGSSIARGFVICA